MDIFNPDDMFKGWYIGNFEPAAYHTTDFEIAIKQYKAGEWHGSHYYEKCDVIYYLIEGEITINEKSLIAPVIFIVNQNEWITPRSVTNCILLIVKTSSVPKISKTILVAKEGTY